MSLAACPFCGGAAEFSEPITHSEMTLYAVGCHNIACAAICSTKWHKSKERATEAWSKRSGGSGPKTALHVGYCKKCNAKTPCYGL